MLRMLRVLEPGPSCMMIVKVGGYPVAAKGEVMLADVHELENLDSGWRFDSRPSTVVWILVR